ncbi:hypothetical protein JG687_00018463 [Phytophthora cactorum]|uniref:Histone H4 n=1 Tax=Phytophthora cactorum TaxID=29920 RepID=A0A8T1TPG3_9STRA|nr:hypothetical protein JG687_00018463 [Phytophthora cactorum]
MEPFVNLIWPVREMAGRGKAQGLGAGGTKRHRKIFRDNIQGITRPTICRLARRAGVIRMSGLMYLQQLLGYVMQAFFFTSSRSSNAAETESNRNQKQHKPETAETKNETAAYPRARPPGCAIGRYYKLLIMH